MNNRYLERVLFLIVYLVGLFFAFQLLGHSILSGNPFDLLLFSGFSALAINILLLGVFFESPKDVIASSLNALILLISLFIINDFAHPLLITLLVYILTCLVFSVMSVLFYNPEEKASNLKQRLSNSLKNISVSIGSSKVLFSIIIGSILIYIYSNEDIAFYIFIGIGLILLINDPIRQMILSSFNLIKSFFTKRKFNLPDPIGHIVAVQAKDIFVIDLIDINKRPLLYEFDFIEFKYGAESHYIRGLIIDRYYLDSQTKIKVLKITNEVINEHNKRKFTAYENNIAYKVEETTADEDNFLDNFVGTIIEHSDMKQINFEYSSKKMLSNGDLVVIKAKYKTDTNVNVLYQVTQAYTNIKTLENKNEIGLIEAKATQLGVWREKERNFENYGWVSSISTPVMLAKTVKGPKLNKGELQIGTIENTKFNVLVNIKDLIIHHTAILGTTGSGKSVFARKLIRELATSGNKIFCIDLTGEARKFLKMKEMIDINNIFAITKQPIQKKLGEYIKQVVDTRGSNYGKNPSNFNDLLEGIESHIKEGLKIFIDGNENIGVFELPELSNTEETLEYTKFFFKALFDLARDGAFKDKCACMVLEEAHTLIPEWNSVGGTDDKTARRLTNTIAQIALQGRKYNVGLLVIAQRTANVSKTILTQCNTIISFKQFDNTSKDFLINHFGDAFVGSLSMLKNRRAIIAGKALVSDVPIIFKVPDILEKEIEKAETTEKLDK